jgi:hypothetical protein
VEPPSLACSVVICPSDRVGIGLGPAPLVSCANSVGNSLEISSEARPH